MERKFFVLFLPLLAAFFPLVSACGPSHGHEEVQQGFSMLGFGVFGGTVQILVVIALGLIIALLIKNIIKMKGGNAK
jgi:hypothetical protein